MMISRQKKQGPYDQISAHNKPAAGAARYPFLPERSGVGEKI